MALRGENARAGGGKGEGWSARARLSDRPPVDPCCHTRSARPTRRSLQIPSFSLPLTQPLSRPPHPARAQVRQMEGRKSSAKVAASEQVNKVVAKAAGAAAACAAGRETEGAVYNGPTTFSIWDMGGARRGGRGREAARGGRRLRPRFFPRPPPRSRVRPSMSPPPPPGVIAELTVRYSQRIKLVNLGLLPPDGTEPGSGGGYAVPRSQRRAADAEAAAAAAGGGGEGGAKKRKTGATKEEAVELL